MIIVASVSCIYGAGNPADYENSIIRISKGQVIARNAFLHQLVNSLYSRTTDEFKRGNFRVKGDVVDIYLAYNDFAYRVSFFGNEIEEIFNVKFDKQIGNEKQLFWTHYNADKTKLVIHTRQLSTNVSDKLLIEIANEIRNFLN